MSCPPQRQRTVPSTTRWATASCPARACSAGSSKAAPSPLLRRRRSAAAPCERHLLARLRQAGGLSRMGHRLTRREPLHVRTHRFHLRGIAEAHRLPAAPLRLSRGVPETLFHLRGTLGLEPVHQLGDALVGARARDEDVERGVQKARLLLEAIHVEVLV